MRVTPCIQVCKLDGDMCTACHRTTQEIMEWRDYTMEDRMRIMQELKERHPKSYCPSCGAPNKCAMELGKSASTCWCFSIEIEMGNKSIQEVDSCYCKKCLETKGEYDES